jgi:hypothetical protein
VASTGFGTVEVVGIKEALREINNYDKRLRRQLTVQYADIMRSVTDEATRLIPVRPPMSGWEREWTPRSGSADFRQNRLVLPWGFKSGSSRRNLRPVKPFLSGKTPKTTNGYTRNLAVMGYRWSETHAVLFDQTRGGNTPQGQQMTKVLNQRYGTASRAMWRAYVKAGPDVQDEIRRLVQKIMRQASAVTRNVKVTR